METVLDQQSDGAQNLAFVCNGSGGGPSLEYELLGACDTGSPQHTYLFEYAWNITHVAATFSVQIRLTDGLPQAFLEASPDGTLWFALSPAALPGLPTETVDRAFAWDGNITAVALRIRIDEGIGESGMADSAVQATTRGRGPEAEPWQGACNAGFIQQRTRLDCTASSLHTYRIPAAPWDAPARVFFGTEPVDLSTAPCPGMGTYDGLFFDTTDMFISYDGQTWQPIEPSGEFLATVEWQTNALISGHPGGVWIGGVSRVPDIPLCDWEPSGFTRSAWWFLEGSEV